MLIRYWDNKILFKLNKKIHKQNQYLKSRLKVHQR